MGVYDYLSAEVTCPYCHKKTHFSCQIKWQPSNLRSFKSFTLGDKIAAIDAIYTGASGSRNVIADTCYKCGKIIKVRVQVYQGVISVIEVVQDEGKLK